ncbi:MAG: TlyA family rRNA (cytidine-2'-O)-methyltransferase, partial [Candidatus Yanofskybacteria bacterium]|nr:TlyA family rRNA (cytidine-2'-O)-methyltransferase [Candidatus Yanofskybacteria bacterium]
YETDKKDLIKGVLKPELVEQVKNAVVRKIENLGFKILVQMESPILGGAGNKEFLLLIRSAL